MIYIFFFFFSVEKKKKGLMLPERASTLPYRAQDKRMFLPPAYEFDCTNNFSATIFAAPYKFTGCTALSVLMFITRSTLFSIATSITLLAPPIFVFTAFEGLYLQTGMCFKAAACT